MCMDEEFMVKENLIKQALIDMEINAKWLEYNFIDELSLLDRYKCFSSSGKNSTEHYRYSVFKQILKNNECLSDRSIDNYIELAKIDNDWSMAAAALMDLLRWRGLNDEQYTRLVNSPEFSGQMFQTYHRNKTMIQTISQIPISDEIVKDCIQNYPSNVQEYLLCKEGIQRHHLECMYQHGKKKSIRNMAKNILRGRRYQ
jgi:hypothetical protein